MKLDRKLNMVIPVERDDGVTYVHAAPISRDTFERYFMVLGKTFTAIYSQGLGTMSGPRVAGLLLKKIAEDMGEWDGPSGAKAGLVADIRRLANVIMPGPSGWGMVPLQEALDHGALSPDDAAEVENAITFFIVASAMHRRVELLPVLDGALKMWGAQVSSLNCTDFMNSLPTSTETASTGAKATASLLPS